MEEISEDEAKSFKDKCFFFLSPFHVLSDDFEMDPHEFDFGTLTLFGTGGKGCKNEPPRFLF